MKSCEQRLDRGDAAPDVAAALCHELRLPIDHLLECIERAHDALRARATPAIDGPILRALRCLADAQATARHLLRVVDGVESTTPVEGHRMRRLDLRGVVRAAAAMQPDVDIAVDAPDAAWVEGVDTRLVHAFSVLLADVVADEVAIVARLRAVGDRVVVELRAEDDATTALRRAWAGRASAVDWSIVRHILAAHAGRLERWPPGSAGVLVRVTLPASRAPG